MISEAEVVPGGGVGERAVAQGATVVTGGKRQGRRFYLPTVLTDVKPEMKVCCQEIFGPVIVLSSYRHSTRQSGPSTIRSMACRPASSPTTSTWPCGPPGRSRAAAS
jgi:hypothetical protein